MNSTPQHARFVSLLAVAATFNTLWAGAAIFRVLVDLPARERIGPVAFADLSRATDLSAGLVFYPVAAIGSALLAVATWYVATRLPALFAVRALAILASFATLSVLAVTKVAAPIMFRIGSSPGDPRLLEALEERFALLTDLRAALSGVGGIALMIALAQCAVSGPSTRLGSEPAPRPIEPRSPE